MYGFGRQVRGLVRAMEDKRVDRINTAQERNKGSQLGPTSNAPLICPKCNWKTPYGFRCIQCDEMLVEEGTMLGGELGFTDQGGLCAPHGNAVPVKVADAWLDHRKRRQLKAIATLGGIGFFLLFWIVGALSRHQHVASGGIELVVALFALLALAIALRE